MLVAKLPVLYKHGDLHFYPSWAYSLPSWLLSIPTSFMEAGCWWWSHTIQLDMIRQLLDDLLSSNIQNLCPTITGNVCCTKAQFDTLRTQVQQKTKRHNSQQC